MNFWDWDLLLLIHLNLHLTVQAILQIKTPKIVVQKSSHLNNILVDMVVIAVIQSHVVVKEQMFKEREPLKARTLVD
jgi:hypothetical protein